MHRITEFFVGLLFGLGLLLSGMTDPAKVLGFLDLFGIWDPSLAFVMGGAIAVGFFAFALADLAEVGRPALRGVLSGWGASVLDLAMVFASVSGRPVHPPFRRR